MSVLFTFYLNKPDFNFVLNPARYAKLGHETEQRRTLALDGERTCNMLYGKPLRTAREWSQIKLHA